MLISISACCQKVLVSGTSLGLEVATAPGASALLKEGATDWVNTRIVDEFSLWSQEDAATLLRNCLSDPSVVDRLMPPAEWFPGWLFPRRGLAAVLVLQLMLCVLLT